MNKFFLKNFNQKAVILDIPLLLENKINTKNYILIFVDAKKKEIQKRLKKRANHNEEILNTDDKLINDFVYSSELFKKVKLSQKK